MPKPHLLTTAALCVASAGVGAVLATASTSAASPSSAATTPAVHYLHGGYVLSEGRCPRGTVSVNAQVQALTNAPSGHTRFGLCYVK